MGEYFVANTTLVTIECYKCHILFAIPREFNDKQLRLKERGGFSCPNGHSQVYTGEREEVKLRRQLVDQKKLKQRLADEQQCCIQAHEEANRFERSLRATKGVVTKLKKKASSK